MTQYPLENDRVRLGVSEQGGFLDPVTFQTARADVSPMHRAPWLNEPLEHDLPPMLKGLRGDFFCAPFGDSDLTPEESRPHGLTANGVWHNTLNNSQKLEFTLEGKVLGATVTKRIHLNPGEAVVYQEHLFSGGAGHLPLGHHAMLRAEGKLELGFSRWVWGGTPKNAVESDPQRGHSSLRYPQAFASLSRVALDTGEFADLTHFPTLEGSEDLLMLVADSTLPFAWTAATNRAENWVWFSLKDPRVLPSTVLWLSNGGRFYPPFSSRHARVLGLEEVCANFHLGHRASNESNLLSERGIQTVLERRPDHKLLVRYAFGLVEVPQGFGQVVDVRAVSGGITLEDSLGLQVFAPCDSSFVTFQPDGVLTSAGST